MTSVAATFARIIENKYNGALIRTLNNDKHIYI